MGRTIAISFGTTNSVAAISDGEAKVLHNREGGDLTPSVVSEYKGEILVGQRALDHQWTVPHDTIDSIKRLIGCDTRHALVQRLKENVPYQIVEATDGTENVVHVVMGGRQYLPIQIASMIIKKLKDDAEICLGEGVEFAVITAPSYFDQGQLDALRKAAWLAGLKVRKILMEPVATAMAFGVDGPSADASRTILVYHLGGGTFDVTIMNSATGHFDVKSFQGEQWFGGDQFNRHIIDHVLKHIETKHGVNGAINNRFMAWLKAQAEQAKIALSNTDCAHIVIPGVLRDRLNNIVDVDLEISRAEFEGMIEEEVAHSLRTVQKVIEISAKGMSPDQIDQVLLAGGSTYIPLVRRVLSELFGSSKLRIDIDPMKCKALGAAILAAKWSEKIECRNGHENSDTETICNVCGASLLEEDGPAPQPNRVKSVPKGNLGGAEVAKGHAGKVNPPMALGRTQEATGPECHEPPIEAYSGEEPFVFVSYSHSDTMLVYPAIEHLHQLGFRIWYDEGIDPGNEWPDEVAKALDRSSFFLVFISPRSVESRNVRNEINFAINHKKPFLAVHVVETVLPRGLELRMGDIQAVMMWRMKADRYQRQIERSLPDSLRLSTL
jgi:molecular chaperone DnaK